MNWGAWQGTVHWITESDMTEQLSTHTCCYKHWGTCIFFNLCFNFFHIYPELKLLGHMVVVFLVFWEYITLFSIVATNLRFHKQCTCVPFPRPILFFFFWTGNSIYWWVWLRKGQHWCSWVQGPPFVQETTIRNVFDPTAVWDESLFCHHVLKFIRIELAKTHSYVAKWRLKDCAHETALLKTKS